MKLPSHLVLIGSTYYYRQKVPATVIPLLGKKYIKHSLRTSHVAQARALACMLSASYLTTFQGLVMSKDEANRLSKAHSFLDGIKKLEQEKIAAIKKFEIEPAGNGYFVKRADSKADYELALLEIERLQSQGITAVRQQVVASQAPAMLLSASIDWYKKKILKTKSKHNQTRALVFLNEFLDFHGDCLVESIKRFHLDTYRQFLEQKKNNSLPTIKNKFSVIGQLFRELKKAGLFESDNPALDQVTYGLKDKRSRHKNLGKIPFSEQEIKLIFSKKLTKSNSPTEYWIPILQLFTGCRTNELCQLEVGDIIKDGEYYCLNINDEGDINKSTKTESTKRKVPLHSTVINLGFVKYVEIIKGLNQPNKLIFPYLEYTANRYAGRQTKAFTRYLQSIGVNTESGRKGTHSFRSFLVQRFQDFAISKQVRMDFIGHSNDISLKDMADSHTISYERKSHIQEIVRIIFPCLEYEINWDDLKKDQEEFRGYVVRECEKKKRGMKWGLE